MIVCKSYTDESFVTNLITATSLLNKIFSDALILIVDPLIDGLFVVGIATNKPLAFLYCHCEIFTFVQVAVNTIVSTPTKV